MIKIVIRRNDKKLKIQDITRKVTIKKNIQKISIRSKSKRGLPGQDGKSAYILAVENGFVGTEQEWVDSLTGTDGIDGIDGQGVPRGGLPGELLVKRSLDDFDTEWAIVTGRDKYYVQAFNVSSEILIKHNLAKYPAITVHDSSGDEVEGTITHVDINTSVVQFSAPFSGIVTCN